jgi:hypothetical protein
MKKGRSKFRNGYRLWANRLAVASASTALAISIPTYLQSTDKDVGTEVEETYATAAPEFSPARTTEEQGRFNKEQTEDLERAWEQEERQHQHFEMPEATPGNYDSTQLAKLSPRVIQEVIDYYGHGKSEITAQDIMGSSKRTKVPELMYLVSFAQEGNFATRGRAKETNNPGNVGNTDDGSNRYLSSMERGLDLYGKTIAREYFPHERVSLGAFIQNGFRRPIDGARYMSDSEAESKYVRIFNDIARRAKRKS